GDVRAELDGERLRRIDGKLLHLGGAGGQAVVVGEVGIGVGGVGVAVNADAGVGPLEGNGGAEVVGVVGDVVDAADAVQRTGQVDAGADEGENLAEPQTQLRAVAGLPGDGVVGQVAPEGVGAAVHLQLQRRAVGDLRAVAADGAEGERVADVQRPLVDEGRAVVGVGVVQDQPAGAVLVQVGGAVGILDDAAERQLAGVAGGGVGLDLDADVTAADGGGAAQDDARRPGVVALEVV